MRAHFSSDHHFFHENIIKYCNRPFKNAQEMNAEMIDRWNSVVQPEDLVFYLGDLTASLKGRIEELSLVIKSLNGKKVFVRGNHDHLEDEWYLENGFCRVSNSLKVGDVLLVHYSLEEAISRGIDSSSWGLIEHVVHGHSHDLQENLENHFNVCVDRHNFKPVLAEDAMPLSSYQKFEACILEMFC